jgi:hypothetical protein
MRDLDASVDSFPDGISYLFHGICRTTAVHTSLVRLRSEGVIPVSTRFQVSLPTPVGVVVNFFIPTARSLVDDPYQTSLLAELDTILATIPGPDLAIQWDVVWEFAMIEGWASESEWWGGDAFTDIIDRLANLGNAVPPTSSSDFTFAMAMPTTSSSSSPPTPGRCAMLPTLSGRHCIAIWTECICRCPGTATTWSTSPHYQNWTSTKTQLYLGLIHLTDGVPGANRRVASARSAVTEFGVATECGFGRRPPESIRQLLGIHRALLAATHD